MKRLAQVVLGTVVCWLVADSCAVAADPVLVAHRGLAQHAPENTLPAFAACVELGIGIELDIRTTKDGQLVVLHDDTLGRTTDGPDRSLREFTLGELKKFDAGGWFHPRFAAVQVPTLEQALALIQERKRGSTILALNIKDVSTDGERQLVDLVQKYGLLGESFAFDQTEESSRRLKTLNPKFRIGANVNRQTVEPRLQEGQLDVFLVTFVPTIEEVRRLQEHGKQVLFNFGGATERHRDPNAWTQAREAGLDGLLTDYALECHLHWRREDSAVKGSPAKTSATQNGAASASDSGSANVQATPSVPQGKNEPAIDADTARQGPPRAIVPFDEPQARDIQRQWARRLAEDVTVTNSLGMTMVLVPAGEFRQGASRRELDAITREIDQDTSVVGGMKKWSIDHIVPNEGPDHAVRISKPYRIAAHELTLGQFRKFVEATGYQTDAEREEIDPASDRVRRTWKEEPDFKNQQEDEPALNVSWNDAMALCHWLGKKEGRRYRLPTEAEWEFAARAGSAGRWCFGNDRSRLDEYAWYDGNSGGKPHPVGTKKPNAFGLFDMHGNMFEYAADFFADTDFEQRFGPKQPIAIDPTGILWGTRTCLRGGSFDTNGYFQRTTSRLGGATRYQYIYHMGCRIVMVLGDDGPSEPVNISLTGRRARNAHAAAEPPVQLVKHQSNPVLEIERDGAECRNSFSITRMDDVWYLWHAAKPPGIERVVSVDGIHWTKPAAKPVRGLGSLFTGGLPLQWDDQEIAMPYALKVVDYSLQRDVLMMYYAGVGKDGASGLGYASFLIGAEARWNKHGFNPLLRGPVLYPCVVQIGETLTLWCDRQIDGRTRICRATSPDGARWTPIDTNSVLPLGKDQEFDSHSQSMPRVLQMGRSLQMWYLGSDGKTTRLGLATSTDGTSWTKSKANPILDVGGKDAWDGGSIIAHDVQWHEGQYHVWYAATSLAEATAPKREPTIRIGYSTGEL